MSKLTAQEVKHYLDVIFTPKPNIPNADWVAFANGTFYFSNEDLSVTRDSLIAQANEKLGEFTGVGAGVGSEYGDFTVHSMCKRFPGEGVWCVSYHISNIMTLVVAQKSEGPAQHETSPAAVGLIGRHCRALDADTLIVIATNKD
jgi:hypothetical protein